MRVKLSEDNLQKLFKKILDKIGNQKIIAFKLGISTRTLNDWKRGKSTIPLNFFKKLTRIVNLKDEELSPKLLPDFWHVKDAARKGAYKRMDLYGNFGTPAGRIKGGFASIRNHKKRGNFKILKLITRPKRSEELAELLGILIGDGHLSNYQVSITTNSKTDREHALFSHNLIRKLFKILPTMKKKNNENALNIVASSKNMVKFLNNKGMPIGNKIQNQLSAPNWIFKRSSYRKAFIRGLFDTDGCIYLDIHRINKKLYKNLGWTITSYADKLIEGIIKILNDFNFSPTYRSSQRSVYLRKQKEIIRYFQEIGTNNPKHYKRYKQFLEEYRSGHNGAVSKTAVPARGT